MRRIYDHIFVVVGMLAIVSVVACGDSSPTAPPPQVVKQKIATTETPGKKAPTPAVSSTAAKPGTPETTPQEAPTAEGDANAAKVTAESSELVKASLEIASEYDPKGRFDPFEPLFKEEPTAPVVRSKDKRKKRVPQTPLERVAISQLKLSAVMRMSKGNKAIVEDATGKGYVIKKGTYVGLNSGQVVRIDKDGVVIEEEIENVMGELIIQNTELKLQKPAGEL